MQESGGIPNPADDALLIATANRHKAREISEFLAGIDRLILDLSAYPPIESPEEHGDTFEANARLKAEYYCQHLGVACVADDSGIEIDALNGAPGIYSARYAGDGCTDADNNAKLLHALHNVPDPLRTARYVCWCVLVTCDGKAHAEWGAVEGRIIHEERGTNGFGYDPLFVPNGYDRTFGQLAPDIKAAISHRARAFRHLRAYLESQK